MPSSWTLRAPRAAGVDVAEALELDLEALEVSPMVQPPHPSVVRRTERAAPIVPVT